MKRIFSMVAVMLIALLVVGCGSPAPAEEPEGKALKTGFAVISSVAKSMPAGAEAGLAQADSTAVGVLVDADGVIVKCVIDAVQTKINFGADGKITTPMDTIVPTKIELGTDYGMSAVATVGEWNEQITAFASYVEGKTLEQVMAIAVDETSAPTDAELTSSVTIKIGGYLAAIEKAVTNAEDMGAMEGDTLGLGIFTNISHSKDATAEAEGVAQAYSIYSLSTFNADGVITSSVLDGSQCNVNFDTAGMITTDLAAPLMTKNELGDDYGMKKASAIGAEWNTQAASFAAYTVGKTVEEVTGVALTEDGVTTDADLVTSVTVGVDSFYLALEKAFAAAK